MTRWAAQWFALSFARNDVGDVVSPALRAGSAVVSLSGRFAQPALAASATSAGRGKGMRRAPVAVKRSRSEDESGAIGELFRQQSDRMWNADADLDWSIDPQIPESKREAWIALLNVFYNLELMGLDVLQVMTSKATHKIRDTDLKLYLAAQAHDEARHVYVLDKYLHAANGRRKLGRLEQTLIDRYGTMASVGLYRVENWLVSTLFSENFAALFLERAVSLPDNDPLATQMFRLILRDEVRHVSFLNALLPDLLGETSRVARAYLWQSQLTLIGAVSVGLRRVAPYAREIGVDIEDFKNQLTANLDAQYQDCGIDEFLHARTSRWVMDRLV